MADHTIDWYVPEFGKNGSLSDIVTHFPGVERAIQVAAVKLAIDATANLAAHHRRGHAEVEIARHPNYSAPSPDWYVYLKDADPGGWGKAGKNLYQRSAMSIEFGWTTKDGKEVPGLHILGGAMNRAVRKYGGPK